MFLSDQRCNQQIDQLDADEGSDQAAGAVDPQVAGEQACCRFNAETHAAERQRDEQRNDQCIEDQRR